MKIVVHKGSKEIGGTCIQLTSGKTSILLDVGLPLSAGSQPVDVANLTVDAVLISHYHQDHYGLMSGSHHHLVTMCSTKVAKRVNAPEVDGTGKRCLLRRHVTSGENGVC